MKKLGTIFGLMVIIFSVIYTQIFSGFVFSLENTENELTNNDEGKRYLELENSEEEIILVNDYNDDALSYDLSDESEDFLANSSDAVSAPIEIDFSSKKINRFAFSKEQLPMKYDLRKMYRTTDVKDQGENGSCWAFATYAALESVLSKYDAFDFSEKHMRNKHGFDWDIYKGGNRDIATAYLARWEGPIDEKDDPYSVAITTSPDDLERMFDIDEVLYLPNVSNSLDRIDIKEAIMNYGGVYTTIKMEKYYENEEHNSYYNSGTAGVNHAVTIVGWNDYFSRKKFNAMPDTPGAWICKNSWGNDYMDDGYFYVSYADVNIGKNNTVFIPKKKDPNGHIYQYDPLGVTKSLGYNNDGYMANAFTSERDEVLHEIGIYNLGLFTEYEIYVANDISSTSELSSKRVKVAEGVMKFPGYHTIDLEMPINISKGETFGVIAYMKSETNRHPIPLEMPLEGYSSQATANKGVSFVSKDGKKWRDIAKSEPNTNVCIKAITTTGDILADNEGFESGFSGLPIDAEAEHFFFLEGYEGFLKYNHTGKLTPIITPEGLPEQIIKYSSSDENIATIDVDGIITPHAVGSTTIKAEISLSNGFLREEFKLKIKAVDYESLVTKEIPKIGYANGYDESSDEPYEGPVAIESIIIDSPHIKITNGQSYDLSKNVSVYPLNAEGELTYESLDTSILTIDENGIITTYKGGLTKVFVKAGDGILEEVSVSVIPSIDDYNVEFKKLKVTKRQSGVFAVLFEIYVNGKKYTGPVNILTVADKDSEDERNLEKTVYCKNGIGHIKYTGFDFGVWRTDFNTKLGVKGHDTEIKYHFSKDSLSPSYVESVGEHNNVGSYGETNIDRIDISKRSGAKFTLTASVSINGKPYTGLGIIEAKADEKINSQTVSFYEGQAEVKYGLSQFNKSVKDFEFVVMVQNVKHEIRHHFED